MTQAGGGNIIGEMIQAVEGYTLYKTCLIQYVCERFYVDMHLLDCYTPVTFVSCYNITAKPERSGIELSSDKNHVAS